MPHAITPTVKMSPVSRQPLSTGSTEYNGQNEPSCRWDLDEPQLLTSKEEGTLDASDSAFRSMGRQYHLIRPIVQVAVAAFRTKNQRRCSSHTWSFQLL